jgi:hypothetical protein
MSETFLFITFIMSLIAIGIVFKTALDGISKVYQNVVANVASEPENIAEIKEEVEMRGLENQQLWSEIQNIHESVEAMQLVMEEMLNRFAKQFPNSAPVKQQTQVVSLPAANNQRK